MNVMNNATGTDVGTDAAAIMPPLLQHLEAEEAWLNIALRRFQTIQNDLALYDLDAVSRHLSLQNEEAEAAEALRKRRAALRNRLASLLGTTRENVTVTGLLSHIPQQDRPAVLRKQRELLQLSRRVAAAQAATQRLILQVHRMSQMFLLQIFGDSREGVRYSADGAIERPLRGQLVEVRT